MSAARTRKKQHKRMMAGMMKDVPSYFHGGAPTVDPIGGLDGGGGGGAGGGGFGGSRGWDWGEMLRRRRRRSAESQRLIDAIRADPDANRDVIQRMTTRGLGLDPDQARAIYDLGGPSIWDQAFGEDGGGYSGSPYEGAYFGLAQQQFGLDQQKFALDQELGRAAQDLAELQATRDYAIAKGNLKLARQTEARIARQEAKRIQLEKQRVAIDTARQQLEQQLGPANALADIGAEQGNIALQRQSEVRKLMSDPRDFVQSQYALGGGTSFLQDVLGGGQGEGQSVFRAGATPFLGEGFQKGLDYLMQRPEEQYFGEAADRLRAVPPTFGPQQQMEAAWRTDPAAREALKNSLRGNPDFKLPGVPAMQYGGSQVIKEPIVAYGQTTGKPKFTAGEGFNPEKIDITPLNNKQVPQFQPSLGAPATDWQKIARDDQSFAAALRMSLAKRASEDPGFAAALMMKPPNTAPATQATQPTTQSGVGKAIQNFSTGAPDQTNAQDIFAAIRGLGAREVPGRAPAQGQGHTIGSFLQTLGRSNLNSLLPSQRSFLESIVSSLGVEPADFWQSISTSLPQGANPNQIAFGNF